MNTFQYPSFQLLKLFLQRSKSSNSGFTLFELLVAMLIVGILAAIALPSFANQIARSRETKAKVQLSSITRAQQAYRLENPTFAESPERLGLLSSDGDYNYIITEASPGQTIVKAEPQDNLLKGFLAKTAYVSSGSVESAVCEGTPGSIPATCSLD
ncbi:MAG TPA: type IV pilin-like G/H family protein [Leptolyngbyaceae cyanobacterium]